MTLNQKRITAQHRMLKATRHIYGWNEGILTDMDAASNIIHVLSGTDTTENIIERSKSYTIKTDNEFSLALRP